MSVAKDGCSETGVRSVAGLSAAARCVIKSLILPIISCTVSSRLASSASNITPVALSISLSSRTDEFIDTDIVECSSV